MIPIFAASVTGMIFGIMCGFALGAFSANRDREYRKTVCEDLNKNLKKCHRSKS